MKSALPSPFTSTATPDMPFERPEMLRSPNTPFLVGSNRSQTESTTAGDSDGIQLSTVGWVNWGGLGWEGWGGKGGVQGWS